MLSYTDKLKRTIKQIPLVRDVAKFIYNIPKYPFFNGSKEFWEKRYKKIEGTSGPGSYGKLAEFKAKIINNFIQDKKINSVLEFGCGDGNQLSLFKIPKYTGLDVSKNAVKRCIKKFEKDNTKSFFLYEPECFLDNLDLLNSDATLSLDVLFHLVEDHVFEIYLKHLFSTAEKYVIIYSSNTDENSIARAPHYKNRKFTKYIESNFRNWQLVQTINNQYPQESPSNFYIYKKIK